MAVKAEMFSLNERYRRAKLMLARGTPSDDNPFSRHRHPAYQELVELGRAAVPLIIVDLRAWLNREAEHPGWWAEPVLESITGVRLYRVTEGQNEAAARLWVDWWAKEERE